MIDEIMQAFCTEAVERGARDDSIVIFGVYAGDKQTIKAVHFKDLKTFVEKRS